MGFKSEIHFASLIFPVEVYDNDTGNIPESTIQTHSEGLRLS